MIVIIHMVAQIKPNLRKQTITTTSASHAMERISGSQVSQPFEITQSIIMHLRLKAPEGAQHATW